MIYSGIHSNLQPIRLSFCIRYSTLLHLPPLDSSVSEDAGIYPRTVAHLQRRLDALITQLDLFHLSRVQYDDSE